MSVARISYGWQCKCCGFEQEATQRVSPAGPLDPDVERVTCSECGVVSVLESEWDSYYGLSIEAVPVRAN